MASLADYKPVGGGYSCVCGIGDVDRCIAGIDCRAMKTTKAMRQARSAAAEADRPRREAARKQAEQEEHTDQYQHVFDRLNELGLDPDELKAALAGLPGG